MNKLVYIILTPLLGLLTLGSCSKAETDNKDTQEHQVSAAGDFYQEAHRTGKLEFGSLKLTKTITTERSAWYKIGSRVAAYSYDIYLKAYVDLDKLDPQDIRVDDQEKTIYLTLPPVEIEVAGRSPELRKEYEHIGIFRSKPDSRERAELKEIANKDFEKEMKSNPEYIRQLRQTAERKARSWMTALGQSRGYTVVFDQPMTIYKSKD